MGDDRAEVTEDQLRPHGPTTPRDEEQPGGDASPPDEIPGAEEGPDSRKKPPQAPVPSDDDADPGVSHEEPVSSEPVAGDTRTSPASTAMDEDGSAPTDTARGDVIDASAPGTQSDELSHADDSAAEAGDPVSPARPAEKDGPPSATTPSVADDESAAVPPALAEPPAEAEPIAAPDTDDQYPDREEQHSDVGEQPSDAIEGDTPGPTDHGEVEDAHEVAVPEPLDGEDRPEVAVSGWAAHEWRLEWKAAMDEREEEVFHVKPPEDADAAASFSIDDEDTPLARELASLTARRRALDDVSLDLSGHRTRVLTISNQKGGVGKTTTSVNIAAALADLGARVLVIDLDPQGNASTALNVPHNADTPSVYDVLIDEFPLADIIQVSPESPNLLCAPSTIHLAGAEIELVSQVAREHRLRTALDDYLASSTERLDFVLIDCPPSLGLLTINAFTAAQEVLLPIQCEYYALEGLSQLLATVRMIQKHLNPELRLSTILLTMYDGRTRLSQQVAEEVRAHFPNEVLNSVIPRSVRVSEAPSFGQTVIAYDGQSAGAVAYREAAVEIVARGESGALGGNSPNGVGSEATTADENHDGAEPVVDENEHVLSEGGA